MVAEEGGKRRVVASGTSCRTQIADFEGYNRPAHPVELLAQALQP